MAFPGDERNGAHPQDVLPEQIPTIPPVTNGRPELHSFIPEAAKRSPRNIPETR
jgi:hypothetical protein